MPRMETKLEALRVAQAELCSGNTNGSIYMQLSHGVAMFLTDRTITLDKVSQGIRNAIEGDDMEVKQGAK